VASRRYRRSGISIGLGLVILLIAAVLYLLEHAQPVVAADEPAATPTSVAATTVLAQLDALEIGYDSAPGYERDAFGDGWKDPDANGCDARNDILARDLLQPVFKPGTHDCVVTSGTLHDPYTGTTIAFVRGQDTSEAVQIDHVVPLSWSWAHGSATWTADERMRFANDPANLRAVDGPTNGSKSDSGPGDWLPPDASYDCAYVSSFVTVLTSYSLSIDEADADGIRKVLSTC